MRRTVIPFVMLVTLITPAQGSGQVRDPLWQKALLLAQGNLHRRPTRMEETEEIRDLEGQLKRKTVSTYRLEQGADGQVKRVLLSALRDGADVTEDREEELDRRDTPARALRNEFNIFHPDWADHNTVRRTALTETIDGHQCVAFDFTVEADKSRWSGLVYLEQRTGVPRKVVTVAEKMPDRKGAKVWGASMEFYYHFKAPHDWHVERIIFTGKFKTTVAWIIPFTGQIRSEARLSGF